MKRELVIRHQKSTVNASSIIACTSVGLLCLITGLILGSYRTTTAKQCNTSSNIDKCLNEPKTSRSEQIKPITPIPPTSTSFPNGLYGGNSPEIKPLKPITP